MPDPEGVHSDGSLQFGSQDVTINTPDGPVVFVAEDIEYEQPTKPLTRPNRYGKAEAEVLIDEIGTGSMTLQLPAASTKAPLRGAPFTLIDVGGVEFPMKISKVGRSWKIEDLIKLKVEIRDLLNPT